MHKYKTITLNTIIAFKLKIQALTKTKRSDRVFYNQMAKQYQIKNQEILNNNYNYNNLNN